MPCIPAVGPVAIDQHVPDAVHQVVGHDLHLSHSTKMIQICFNFIPVNVTWVIGHIHLKTKTRDDLTQIDNAQ